MLFFYAILLAIVQGITEFLPISSSGHLFLLHSIFGETENSLAFDVALHWGTLVAVIGAFRGDLWKLLKDFVGSIRNWTGTSEQRLPWLMLLTSIPAGVVGVLYGDQLEHMFRSIEWIALMLIGVAFLFFAVERASTQERSMHHMNWKDALLIGIAQILALVPGTSRSGITIVAGMARNLSRMQAARYSFLASVPLIAGAGTTQLFDLVEGDSLTSPQIGALILGVVVSGLVGWLAIVFLLKIVARYSLRVFAWYRIVLAILVIVLIRYTS